MIDLDACSIAYFVAVATIIGMITTAFFTPPNPQPDSLVKMMVATWRAMREERRLRDKALCLIVFFLARRRATMITAIVVVGPALLLGASAVCAGGGFWDFLIRIIELRIGLRPG